jgi:lipoate-protein ligase A
MYRYLPFKKYNPYFKKGLNKALMESVRNGSDPVVFLAGWKQKCVNLGYSQDFEEEVNVDEFQGREDVVLVRRQGGGGTTFLTPDGEITWGIVTREQEYPDDVNKIYEMVCSRIAEGLKEIGVEAEHEPINDIVTEKGKISGATIRKEDGIIYIGGTLLFEVDVEEMFSLLTPNEDKKKDKQISEFRERVSTIKNESEASFDESARALSSSLLKDKDFRESKLNISEVKRAEELANKYSGDEWLYKK